MPAGTAVVTFPISHPKINSCLSKRTSFRKPSSLSFTSPGAEEGILAVDMRCPVFQPVLAAGQSRPLDFVGLITRLMNLILPNSREAPF